MVTHYKIYKNLNLRKEVGIVIKSNYKETMQVVSLNQLEVPYKIKY